MALAALATATSLAASALTATLAAASAAALAALTAILASYVRGFLGFVRDGRPAPHRTASLRLGRAVTITSVVLPALSVMSFASRFELMPGV